MPDKQQYFSRIDGCEDVLDTRDIIARIDFLCLSIGIDPVETVEDMEAAIRAAEEEVAEHDDRLELDLDDYEELKGLLKFQEDEADYISGYRDGEALIKDSYFKEYAQDLAYDLGFLCRDVDWFHTCIDWDQAAKKLKVDYREVTLRGESYWVRA